MTTRTSSRRPMAAISSASARRTVDGSELLFGWPKQTSATPSSTYDDTLPVGARGTCEPILGSGATLPHQANAKSAAKCRHGGVAQRVAAARCAHAGRRSVAAEARVAVDVHCFAEDRESVIDVLIQTAADRHFAARAVLLLRRPVARGASVSNLAGP